MTETVGADGLRIQEVRRGGPVVDRIYTDILRPSFPPAELAPLAALRAGVTQGTVTLVIAMDTFGNPHGAAVGEWWPQARIMTLSYLAAVPGERGRGIGGRLLPAAIDSWRQRYRPCVLLAALERPDRYRESAQHGDPVARLRFYQRYGARALDLPHFQPALSPGADRTYGMLLITLHVDEEFQVGTDLLAGAPVARFLAAYLARHEPDHDDPAATALLAGARRPGGIRLVDLSDYHRIPASDG